VGRNQWECIWEALIAKQIKSSRRSPVGEKKLRGRKSTQKKKKKNTKNQKTKHKKKIVRYILGYDTRRGNGCGIPGKQPPGT